MKLSLLQSSKFLSSKFLNSAAFRGQYSRLNIPPTPSQVPVAHAE